MAQIIGAIGDPRANAKEHDQLARNERRNHKPGRCALMMLVRAETIRSLPVALAATAWFGHVPAEAAPASPVPDFYQHQAWLPANPAGMNGWEGWQAADYVANGGKNAALNEAVENGKQGYCWYASIVDALYPWTQYRTSTGAAPFANLFGNRDIATPGKWVSAYESAMLAAIAAGPGTGAVSINGYLNSLNFGPTRNTGGVALTDTSFTVAANGTVMVRLAGRTEATTFSPVALAGLAYNNGWTDVVTIKPSPPPQPTLWWTTSFHAMAIAGLGGANQLMVADPDSVPINAGNFNGGWWNFAGIKAAATLAGRNAAATASLAAAVAAVQANMYTNAQAAGPTPVPGAGYTAADLYGSITLSSTAGQQNQITAASNATYGGKTRVDTFDVINTLAMTRKFIAPMARAAPAAGVTPTDAAYRDTFEWTGEIAEDVEQIAIFTVAPLADSTFTFTAPGWSESLVTTDPFGGTWTGGGEDLSVTPAGSDLAPGGVADATLDTTAPADQYNVFFQLDDGAWMVQSFGADDNAFGVQPDFVGVPEPGTPALLGTGFVGLLGIAGRNRRRVRARERSGFLPGSSGAFPGAAVTAGGG
jgi:hypothetical protein